MPNKILITGGSGLVGNHLTKLLITAGHEVIHLSRNVTGKEITSTYRWQLDKSEIDESAFNGVNHIIHLAGAGVADSKWTPKRKREILASRVDSTRLLFSYVKKLDLKLDSYITASAIGIYADVDDQWVAEGSLTGSNFLADVVKQWEQSANQFNALTKVAKVRIGIVLSQEAGALAEIAKPIKMYAGAPLGSGSQYMSWIHLHDLAMIFKFVLENKLEGTFNAVAPNPVTNKTLTKSIARVLKKPLILPNVPSFAMKLLLGEMADMVLSGSRVSATKIQTAGFKFRFEDVDDAVSDLLG